MRNRKLRPSIRGSILCELSLLVAGLLAALVLTSCGIHEDSDGTLQAGLGNSVDDLRSLYASAPPNPAIVTCCEIRNDLGNHELTWGGGSDCAILVPDSAGHCVSLFVVNPSRFLAWVERAFGPGETPDWDALELIGGATVNSAPRPIVKQLSLPGVSTVDRLEWDCSDQAGSPVPDGYYRIYSVFERSQYTGAPVISWVDLLVIKDLGARRDFIANMKATE